MGGKCGGIGVLFLGVVCTYCTSGPVEAGVAGCAGGKRGVRRLGVEVVLGGADGREFAVVVCNAMEVPFTRLAAESRFCTAAAVSIGRGAIFWAGESSSPGFTSASVLSVFASVVVDCGAGGTVRSTPSTLHSC